MKCPNCGLENREPGNSCDYCGAVLVRQKDKSDPPDSVNPELATGDHTPPEQILWDERPSVRTMLPVLFAVAAITALSWHGASHIPKGIVPEHQWHGYGLTQLGILGLASGFSLLYILIKLIRILSIRYTLSDQRLYLKSGFFSRSTDEIDLDQYTDTFIRRGFLEKVLRIGDLQVVTEDVTNPTVNLTGLANPVRKMASIRAAARDHRHLRNKNRSERIG